MQAHSALLASRAAFSRGCAGSGPAESVGSSRRSPAAIASFQASPSGHRQRRRRRPPLTAAQRDHEVGLHTQEPSIDNDASSFAADSNTTDSGSSRSFTRLLAAPAQLLNLPLPRGLGGAGAQPASSSNGSAPSSGEQGSDPASPAMREVDEVYENQRLFAVVWKPPLAALDWPEWSDARGNPVLLAKPPHEDPGAWQLVVTGATDDEGWCYATVFK